MASPLLQLPADIRNIIYDFVFYTTNGIHIDLQQDKPNTQPNDIFALSRTCKALYRETRDLPYWLNETHVHIPLLQDLSTIRSRSQLSCLTTPNLTIQPATHVYKARRVIHLPGSPPTPINSSNSSYLTSTLPTIRQKAQEYITLAMRLPHLEPLLSKLSKLTLPSYQNPSNTFLQRVRKLHIHLGSQTENIFLERFFTAFDAVAPLLAGISRTAASPPTSIMMQEIRITFQLRLSRRLVVSYDFDIFHGIEQVLAEMDRNVHLALWTWTSGSHPGSGDSLSLPELASINAVRERVCRGLMGGGKDGNEGKKMARRSGGYQVKSPAVANGGRRRSSNKALQQSVEARERVYRAAAGGGVALTAAA